MADGVVLQTREGDIETHRALARDVIQVDVRFGDGTGDGTVMNLAHGLYLISLIPIENGAIRLAQRDVLMSSATRRAWPEPQPNKRWGVDAPDGGLAVSGPQSSVRIGACRYDAFEVKMTFADDPAYTEVYTYLPALGIGLLTQSTDEQGTDRYTYTSIGHK